MTKRAYSSHSLSSLGSRVAIAAGFWLSSCGGADHAPVLESSDAGSEQAQVNSGVNVCPVFTSSLLMPQRLAAGQSATIVVRATDPDAPDSQLVFAWSAASGSFSSSDKPTTSYRCAELGTQRLICTATDRVGCVSSLKLDVECAAN